MMHVRNLITREIEDGLTCEPTGHGELQYRRVEIVNHNEGAVGWEVDESARVIGK